MQHFGPGAPVPVTQEIGSDRRDNGHRADIVDWSKMTDAVEKGKNELTEIFLFALVETGIS